MQGRVCLELTCELCGDGSHIGMMYAACGHALMNGIYHYSRAARLERIMNGFCALSGLGFLRLEAFGKYLDDLDEF